MDLPPRDRAVHARQLIEELQQIAPQAQQRAEEQRAQGIDAGNGVYLVFESEPEFGLKFESLDVARSGIELCAVRQQPDNRMQATVFVPDEKLVYFLKRVEAYRDTDTAPRKDGTTRPKNQDLIDSISHIRLAALEALWTDDPRLYPAADQEITWEVWLRRSEDVDHLARLRAYAERFGISVSETEIWFVDRTVVLVHGTAAALTRSVEILGTIAELRLAKETAAFFTQMNAVEQRDWAENLAGRLQVPDGDAPHVCLLDTGVNAAHPLLAPVTDDDDLHSYKPAWGADDRQGHGTPMAGLATYGDLTELLASADPVTLTHRIESVKIINPADPHEKDLYGAVTRESAYRVEVKPDRTRIYCMAVTATDDRDRGRPSSWSAAVDALAAGENDQRRLFILSAGNTVLAQRRYYPDSNMTDGVHDPAQAWNALTVGGYTEKSVLDTAAYPGWRPLAGSGDLAPCSCTSVNWTRTRWPIKPDIVLEAGNMAINDAHQDPDYIDDGLQLLSTHHNFTRDRPLTTFGDTSAAAAGAARMAAALWSKYPDFTPETVRGLLVHAADWTPAMLTRFTEPDGAVDYEGLMRCFGYGVPDFGRLMSSADNSLTLITQGVIQPFFKEDGGAVKTREMRLHALPWPLEVLEKLGATDVRMRVTLSYFIEPSPGARGWTSKYGYQSYGLRFAVKTPLENPKAFEDRINKRNRDDDYESPGLGDTGRWLYGYALRSLVTLGSVHSDVWTGTAADLAARGHIAVFPTMGWWNKRPHLGAWEKQARYSLIVDIQTPEVEMDVYTAVANQIGVPVVIELE